MKHWKSAIFFVMALVLQPLFSGMIGADGKSPNLLLALVLVFGYLYRDKLYAICFGSIAGVIYDFLMGQVIGMTAFPLFITAIVVYLIANEKKTIVFFDFLWIYALSAFIYYFTHFLVVKIVGYKILFFSFIKGFLLIGIMTLPIAVILYASLVKNAQKRERRYY